MSTVKNHAIIVTGTYGGHVEQAQKIARGVFPWVSDLSPAVLNGSRSFFVPPDGSKEHWEASTDGDNRRAEFKRYLREQALAHGEGSLSWVEVLYGGDVRTAAVVAASTDGRPAEDG